MSCLNKWLSRVILPAALILTSGLKAHPFDESYAVSKSLFIIKEEKIELKINFFINSYIKLYSKNAGEYDVFEAVLKKELKDKSQTPELAKMKSYILSKIRVFVDKAKIAGKITELKLDFDTLKSNEKRLRTVRVTGVYQFGEPPKSGQKVYIFNQLFEDAKEVHVGMAEIEHKDDVFDFMFSKTNYFVIDW